MNQKKAKALRREMKSWGADYREAKYEEGPKSWRTVSESTASGLPVDRRVPITGTITLSPGCPKSQYRFMKQAAA